MNLDKGLVSGAIILLVLAALWIASRPKCSECGKTAWFSWMDVGTYRFHPTCYTVVERDLPAMQRNGVRAEFSFGQWYERRKNLKARSTNK